VADDASQGKKRGEMQDITYNTNNDKKTTTKNPDGTKIIAVVECSCNISGGGAKIRIDK